MSNWIEIEGKCDYYKSGGISYVIIYLRKKDGTRWAGQAWDIIFELGLEEDGPVVRLIPSNAEFLMRRDLDDARAKAKKKKEGRGREA